MAVDDSYTKALLHFEGADASTTFTDESGKTWTKANHAQIDTAQYKFGASSGLFDGTDDYVSTPDSADWYLDDGTNTNAFTIDTWVRFASINRAQLICEQYQDVNNWWKLWMFYDTGTTWLRFTVKVGGGDVIALNPTWAPSADTWYHIALVKNGTNWQLYVDGSSIASGTDTDVMGNITGSLTIGGSLAFTPYFLNGWLDEFRISKGIARWTANFTPPTAPYGASGGQITIWESG